MHNIYNLHNTFIYDLLTEERGVNKSYIPIGDELYNNLIRTEPTFIDRGIYAYRLINFKPSEESFVEGFNVLCYVGLDRSSSFDIYEDELHLTKGGKLKNILFKLFVKPDDTNNKLPDKNEFMTNFCHEFHHAYRYYCIISKNNGELSDSERSNNNVLTIIQKVKNVIDKDSEFERYLFFLTNIVYYVNDNEKNTYISELYEYLRQHGEINQYNFADKANEMEFYFYPKLADALVFIDKNNNNTFLREAIFTICTSVLGWNVDKQTALMKFRQYIARKAEKIQSQFFKTGIKALYDLGRYGEKNEDFIRNIKVTGKILEILNKC